jgi:hypothetical protein
MPRPLRKEIVAGAWSPDEARKWGRGYEQAAAGKAVAAATGRDRSGFAFGLAQAGDAVAFLPLTAFLQ